MILEVSEKLFLSLMRQLCEKIPFEKYKAIAGIPRGGAPVAAYMSAVSGLPLVPVQDSSPDVLIVDDLADSGTSRSRYHDNDFAVLFVKSNCPTDLFPTYYCVCGVNDWVRFWWEEKQETIQDNITRILQYIGEDPSREGLVETHNRVARSYEYLFSGYKQSPSDLITVFENDGYNQIILLKDIELYSMCEHHMLPFYGKAHVAYIPNKKIIGVSKLARIVDLYARRLQIQERIGEQVTSTLMEWLEPLGAACIIEAIHLCMRMRGVSKQNSVMVTSSLKGVFMDNMETREELLRLIK